MRWLPLALVAVIVGCSDSPNAPTTRIFKVVSIDGGKASVVTHYFTPATSLTEQWVAVGDATLTITPYGSFELLANSAYGSAQYHMNGVAKVYDVQAATGGGNSLSGSVVAGTLRFENSGSMYARPADYTGRLSGDSAIVENRMTCATPVGPDSSHVFTLVLK
jgi:hypothetical protein